MTTMSLPASLEFDVDEIPFSARGSWLNLSRVVGLHQRAQDIHLVTHQTGMHAVLRLVPEHDGEPVGAATTASPSVLRWTSASGVLEATFDGLETVRLRGHGVDLRIADAAGALTPFTGTYLFTEPGTSAAVFTSYETGRRYRVTPLEGHLVVQGDGALGAQDRSVLVSAGQLGQWELAIQEFETSAEPYASSTSFDELVATAGRTFDEYVGTIAPWRSSASPAAALAAYVLWSATVSPKGFLRRESILMSKHWMDKVWSWDHAFNALAVAAGLPSLALDQFLTPFDHQDATGAPPDSVTHSEILYNYVKPPIHGWALGQLRSRMDAALTKEQLLELHGVLSRWTAFWLDHRRVDGHPLPYYQHGNDSGWDNSTTFDLDRVIESPDLAAFLVVQLDTLIDLERELGIHTGDRWQPERDRILDALLTELWDGEHFFARSANSGRRSATTSLLNLLPLIGGKRLPLPIRERLAAGVRAHLTEFGPATEIPGTAHYESDGYWRGPIWAPSTVLIESGLRASGFPDLADEVSARFRMMCERSGFAENFDAVTGEGLRDRAYTWTASAYLLLSADAIERAAVA